MRSWRSPKPIDVWQVWACIPGVQQEYAWIEEKLLTPGVVAVGDRIGTRPLIVRHRMQLQAFEHQMDLAERFDLPVVIPRDARAILEDAGKLPKG